MSGFALSATEMQAAEALLTGIWGAEAKVRSAEPVWDRAHVIRLHTGADRSVVLKRRGEADGDRQSRGFRAELAVLEYLTSMPVPVAPRLLGADTRAGILLMEDLGPGASLADSLLTGTRADAQADLIAYAQALASMHVWSMQRPGELASIWARCNPGTPPVSRWVKALERSKEATLTMATSLGLATSGVAGEIAELGSMLTEADYTGLVHGDACPDNVRLTDGRCRIFDS